MSAVKPGLTLASSRSYTVGAGGDFADVQTALLAVNRLVIPVGVTITLTLLDGTITSTTPVLVSTPFGRQINIVGQNTYTKTLSSIQSSSGSTGAWSVILNLNSVTNIAVNDYIVITAATGGTNPTYIDGALKVTNVDAVNTRITVASTHRAAAAPSGAVTGSVTVLKSVLQFNGCDGIQPWNGGCGINLDNFVIAGNGTSFKGVANDDVDRVFVQHLLAVVGFGGAGIAAIQNSETNCDGVLVASGNGIGFYAAMGGSINSAIIASGNTTDGVNVATGGQVTAATSSVVTGSGSNGWHALDGGIISAQSTAATGNALYGYLSERQGYINGISVTGANNTSGLSWLYFGAVSINVAGTLINTDGSMAIAGSIAGAGANGAYIRHTGSSNVFPTLDPNRADSTTGIGGASGTISMIVASGEKMRFTATTTNLLAPLLSNATSLPTADPHVSGQLWNNAGVVTVSAG